MLGRMIWRCKLPPKKKKVTGAEKKKKIHDVSVHDIWRDVVVPIDIRTVGAGRVAATRVNR